MTDKYRFKLVSSGDEVLIEGSLVAYVSRAFYPTYLYLPESTPVFTWFKFPVAGQSEIVFSGVKDPLVVWGEPDEVFGKLFGR